jgi:hypothetical protein
LKATVSQFDGDNDSELARSILEIICLILPSAMCANSRTHLSRVSSIYHSIPQSFVRATAVTTSRWTTRDLGHFLKVLTKSPPSNKQLPLIARSSQLVDHWQEWFRGMYGSCSILNMNDHFEDQWSHAKSENYYFKMSF